MFNSTKFDRAEKALEALNFSEENDKIAALQARRAEIEAATRKGEQRNAEIDDILGSLNSFDGGAVAAALLEGKSAVDHQGADALRQEQQALASGLRQLQNLSNEAARSIEDIQRAAGHRIYVALEPLAEALLHEARSAAQIILDAHAAVQAINRVSGKIAGPTNALKEAVGDLHGGGKLLPYVAELTLSPDIKKALDPALSKGDAVNVWRIPEKLPV